MGKIYYAQNPLVSRIELNELEKHIFFLKYVNYELYDEIGMAHFYIENTDKESALSWLFRGKQEELFNKRDKEVFQYYLGALSDTHIGDCTCFSAPCSKCFAEDFLGINTLSGLGKYAGSYLYSQFSSGKNIEEVLTYLKDYMPKGSFDGWEQYAEKWSTDAKHAYEWLLKYRIEKMDTTETFEIPSWEKYETE